MHRPLFLRIVQASDSHDEYFVQKRDAVDVMGLSPLQKVTTGSCSGMLKFRPLDKCLLGVGVGVGKSAASQGGDTACDSEVAWEASLKEESAWDAGGGVFKEMRRMSVRKCASE
ncbi:hypothetical protein PsorP6_015903 [Peronosclerospora sorghi]|uniref:Uncharacterized protein n=1 Tax=Peronosclerospora sorghi TaxID=230839 RepID=A0ACC0WM94_9STRA|nr:hypothetical protein PsorP6_015903 [Peronosclerospora sorghi]